MPLSETIRAIAGNRAAELGSDFVGIEHIFLVALEAGEGPVAAAIRDAGLSSESFQTILAEGKPPRRPPGTGSEKGSLTTHAERIFERATERATAIGRDELIWDDVFLALVLEPRGAIAKALTAHSLRPSRLKSLAADRVPKREKKVEELPAGGERVSARERRRQKAAAADPAPAPAPARREARRPRADPEIDAIPEAKAPERPQLSSPPRQLTEPPRPANFKPAWLLFLAIPAAIWLNSVGRSPVATFLVAALAVIPLAGLMGQATEHLAERSGPTLGGLLNATFGNAAELIIGLIALRAGYVDLVKASITGSILGNLLLILGLSLVAGGMRASLLRFNRTNAGMSAAMLSLAVAGLIFPALFDASRGATGVEEKLFVELAFSEAVSVILVITYLLSLLFVLRTHRPLLGVSGGSDGSSSWGTGRSIGALLLSTAGLVVLSEILVGVVEPVTLALGVSETFLGLILIPLIGNAAEHASAVIVARKGNTDLAFQISLGSSTQVALLVAPILVFAGAFMGVAGMNLVFTTFEVVALSVAVIVSTVITLDGESHWFEGVQLLALYAILGVAAWFL